MTLDREAAARQLLAVRLSAPRAPHPMGSISRRPDPHAPARLSSAQARILLTTQYEPDSPAYHVPMVLHLRGPLDRAALLHAVRDLAERHQVLRSVIDSHSGEPLAVVRPADEVPVSFTDLASDNGVSFLLFEEATRPFDLATQCPMRAVCFGLGPERHVLALTVHHVATDASSNAILVAELARLYAARLAAADPPRAPRLQYADVAAWERGRQTPERLGGHLRWWRERLRDLPPVLQLPLDRPRQPGVDPAGDCVPFELSADLSARVRAIVASEQATVSAVLLAAWQALLNRVADTEDLAVGVVTSSRRHPQAELVPGCFVDTLAVRGDLSGKPTVADLIGRARDALLDAMSHAEAPLEQVIGAVRPERVAGAAPLFQAVLNVYHAPDAVTGFPGVTVELGETFTNTARFDLSLGVLDAGPAQPFRGRMIYRTALFDPTTAGCLRDWYVRLLTEMVADLDRPVGRLPLADVGGPVLAGPVREYPLDRPLHHHIEAQVARRPEATAVVAPDGTLTYAELDARAGRLAGRLRAEGVGPDQPVAVLVEPSLDLPVGMLAALKAGGAYLPIDPDTPPGRVAALLAAAESRVVLTQRQLLPRFAAAAGSRPVIAMDDTTVDGTGPGAAGEVAGSNLAYVIFTSGSTGTPKGVAVEHASIVGYLRAAFERLGEPAAGGRSFAQVSTAAADLGLTCLLGALTTGGTLHLVDRATAVDPGALAGYFRQHPIDVLKLVPSHLELLARHGDLATVLPRRLLILAGETCPWTLVDRVRAARADLVVHSHYGPTETTVAVMACDVAEVPPESRHGFVPLGRPLPNVVGHVVDAGGRALPAGVPGELMIGGPGVARGYLGGDAGSARFGPDPLSGAGRCYRTGDRVRVRPDGTVEFHGRVDDQVKIRGYRVEPGEVAAALRTLPGVADAVVLPDGEGSRRRLLAWLVGEPGHPLDAAAALTELRGKVPEHMVPAAVVVLDALPLGPNGKVDRAALPPPEATVVARTPPATGTERRIAGIWRELLDGCEVGRDDNFFALGGDSFRAVLVTRAIGRGLRAIDLFTHPTVRSLAALLDAEAGPAARLEPAGLLHRLSGPPADQAALTVVCVPYGGGSAAAYRPLALALPDDVAVLAVELPGHDPAQPDEALLTHEQVIERCAGELAGRHPKSVVVYGHCVGTALAAGLAHRIEDDGLDLAGVVLGASFPYAKLPGRLAEWLNRILPTDRWLPDRSYRDALRVMGALIDEAGDGADSALMLRALRHDAREAEAWFTQELARTQPRRLAAPVISVIGERDRGTELYQERYQEWTAFAERVELATVPRAGHYFLNHQADRLAAIVTGALRRWRAGDLPPYTSPAEVAGREGRRNLRAFRAVAAGQLVSMVGTQLSSFALGVWVFQSTGRLFDFAMITMLALVPAIVAAPLGGVLTDRYDRRRIMMATDTASAVAIGSLALLYWVDRLALWHILLAVTAGSLATAVQRPAYLASIAQLVPKPYLVQANALAQIGTGLGTLIAPVAGGVLVVLIDLPGVILVDLATFCVGVATLLAVRFPRRLFRKREESFRSAFAGGWRFIAHRRPLIVMTAYFVPVNYLAAITLVLVTPLVLDLGSPVSLGVATAVGGLGAVLGSLAMIAWGGTARRAHGMVGLVIGVGVGTLLMGVGPSVVGIAAGLFLWWGSTSVVNAHWMAIIGVKVGPHLQGRVLAVNQMLATAMMPLGFFTAPLAERVFGAPALLVVSGVTLLVWGVLGLCYPPLRTMEDHLPDAVAGAEIADDLDEVQTQLDGLLDAVQLASNRPELTLR